MGFIHCKRDSTLFIHDSEQHSKRTNANSSTFSRETPPHDAAEVIKAPSKAQMRPSIRRLSYLTHLDGSDSISTARKFARDYLKVVRLSSSCDDSPRCQRTFDCSLHLRVAPGSFQPSSRANATETMERRAAENTHTQTDSRASAITRWLSARRMPDMLHDTKISVTRFSQLGFKPT